MRICQESGKRGQKGAKIRGAGGRKYGAVARGAKAQEDLDRLQLFVHFLSLTKVQYCVLKSVDVCFIPKYLYRLLPTKFSPTL